VEDAYKIIESLDRLRLIAYVAANAERFMPKYVSFVERGKWGDPAVLRQTLDLVWQTTTGDRRDEELRELEDRCLAVTPDNDEFNDQGAYQACCLVGDAIYTALTHNDSEARNIAGGAYESIAEIPVNLDERTCQEKLLRSLIELDPLTPQTLREFRSNSRI